MILYFIAIIEICVGQTINRNLLKPGKYYPYAGGSTIDVGDIIFRVLLETCS